MYAKMRQPWCDERGHTNNLDFLRFFFAALVIFSHSYPLLYGEQAGNQIEPLWLLTRGQLTGGRLAVAFFFIISGFLITASWMRSQSISAFFVRRVLRIYPGFIVMSLGCMLLVVPLAMADSDALLRYFTLPHLLLYQVLLYLPGDPGIFVNNPIPGVMNGSVWTIRYEFWCYVFLALLGISRILRHRTLVLGLFGAWLLLLIGSTCLGIVPRLPFESGRTWFIFGSFNHYVEFTSFFLGGTVFYLYRERIPYSRRLLFVSAVALGLLAATGVGLLAGLAVFGTYIVFYLGFTPTRRLSHFSARGDFSYGVYLYAFPIQQLMVLACGTGLQPMVLSLAAFGPTLIIAIGSWYLIEQPALRQKDFHWLTRARTRWTKAAEQKELRQTGGE